MASQGPLGAGTGADSTDIPGASWTNAGNITADDSSFATSPLTFLTSTHYLKATNFGFTVPSGATINGIVVEWKRKTSSTSLSPRDGLVRIIKGGSVSSAVNYATGTTWPTTEAYASYGTGTTDLWGNTWTHTDINASNFGVALTGQCSSGKGGPTLSVNYCRITVYYTESSGAVLSQAMALLAGLGNV